MSKVDHLKELAVNLTMRGNEIIAEVQKTEDFAALSRSYHEWYGSARGLVRDIAPALEENLVNLYYGERVP